MAFCFRADTRTEVLVGRGLLAVSLLADYAICLNVDDCPELKVQRAEEVVCGG